jgi:hypothetical protein
MVELVFGVLGGSTATGHRGCWGWQFDQCQRGEGVASAVGGWWVGSEGAACKKGGAGEEEAEGELGRLRLMDVARMKMTRGSHAHPIP